MLSYIAISGFTLPHFDVTSRILAILLALVIMAVTRESLRICTVAAEMARSWRKLHFREFG